MIPLRFCSGSPGRLRVIAAGAALAVAAPALAASSATGPLDSAIKRELDALRPGEVPTAVVSAAAEDGSNTGEPEKLPKSDPSEIQKVSGEQPPVPPPTKPQPTAAQLEVMKQLEEMYKRDGREMPSMRMKDAPNTYLPQGQVVRPVSDRSAAPASSKQSELAGAVPPAPAPAPRTNQPEVKRGFLSFFKKPGSKSAQRKSSLFGRSTRPSNKNAVAASEKEGFFGKLFSPFQKQSEPASATQKFVPTPPPLPEEYSAPSFAERTNPPQLLEPAGSRSLDSQNLLKAAPAPVASTNAPVREREPNPFAEVLEESQQTFPKIVIRPAHLHPLNDPFADIEGEAAPDLAFVAAIDPDFADIESAGAGMVDLDAPRTLEPETVAETHDFAPPQLEAPAAKSTESSSKSSAGRYAELQRRLAERSGLGGFQGFCPVALRDRRELVDSRPEFLSVYRGRTYELSSAEAKARFEANPTKYAPVSGGNDVVLMARGEVDAEGNLNHAVWFKDQLYLFRSAETVREFNSEPTKYSTPE